MGMTPTQQAELTLLRLKARLATRHQDLAIAQKAHQDTSEIETQILGIQTSIDLIEKSLKRLSGGRKK
jgi:hypothetical protein